MNVDMIAVLEGPATLVFPRLKSNNFYPGVKHCRSSDQFHLNLTKGERGVDLEVVLAGQKGEKGQFSRRTEGGLTVCLYLEKDQIICFDESQCVVKCCSDRYHIRLGHLCIYIYDKAHPCVSKP